MMTVGELIFLMFLCVTSFSIFFPQEYEKALKYVRILMRNEPGNKQAIELEKLIDKALKKGMRVGGFGSVWVYGDKF